MTSQPAANSPPDRPQMTARQAQLDGTGTLPPHQVRRTRIGGLWVAAAMFALVLLLLLIFILENGQKISVSFFGATGHLPLGVALLLAAVLGVLLVVIPGTARIIQLRITAGRHRRIDTAAAADPVPAAQSPPADPGQP
jgi:uncharacterized integral membrane protein